MKHIFKILFLCAGLFLFRWQAVCAANNFDAGGFAGKSFSWDYSLYFPTMTGGESSDPGHITWNGKIATFVYATAGTRSVTFTFKDSAGVIVAQGVGTVNVAIEDGYWTQKPRVMWGFDFVRNDFRNGSINYAKTEAAARALNVNTLTYSLSYVGFGNNYAELENNLANIRLNAWAVLRRNPSIENSPPFGYDYNAWAEYLANLSLKYPNLKAFQIDDTSNVFGCQTGYTDSCLDVAKLRAMLQVKNRINPNLRFLPVLYVPDWRSWILPADKDEIKKYYGNSIWKSFLSDGALVGYYDSFNGVIDTAKINVYGQSSKSLMGSAPMIYGGYPAVGHGYGGSYGYGNGNYYYNVQKLEALFGALGAPGDGAWVYNVPLWAYDTSSWKNGSIFKPLSIEAHLLPRYSYKFGFGAAQNTADTWYQGVQQKVVLPDNITSASLSFREFDNINNTNIDTYRGQQFKQVVVNNEIYQNDDIAMDGTVEINYSLNCSLSEPGPLSVAGKTFLQALAEATPARITIRLYDEQSTNWPVETKVYVGNINLKINGTQISNNNWLFISGIGDYTIKKYNEMFSAIGSSFGKIAMSVCSPGSVDGCKVCSADGSAWMDTDSKCAGGQKCQAGICMSVCTNECSLGAKQCSGISGFQTCAMSDGCLKWGATTACSTGQTCSRAGVCVAPICVVKTCVALGNYECGSWSDGCGATIGCGSCAAGKTCSAGKCVSNCTSRASKKCDSGNLYWYNSCNAKEELVQNCGIDMPLNDFQCSGTWVQQQITKKGCANNACSSNNEWTNTTDCSVTSQVCSNGACAATCAPNCSGKSCGNDGCGGSCGTCESNQTCNSGVCQANGGSPSPEATANRSGGGGGNSNPPVQPVVNKPVSQMTRAEIMAKINEIVALIAKLQAQLKTMMGAASYSCAQITKNLFYGMVNDPQAVKCLQEVLKFQNYAVAVSGNYDAATKTAVAQFQQKYASEILAPYHLIRGSGNVGNATRTMINNLLSGRH